MTALDLYRLTSVAQRSTVTHMTTTTYPLTPYRYPNVGEDVELPRRFVGTVGGSDFDQVAHILANHLLNDPKHFYAAFPMWAKIARDIDSADDDTAVNAWETLSAILPDVDSWLADYEGIDWEGGEPYRLI